MVKLEETTTIRAPIETCFDLARSVEVYLAGNTQYEEQAVGITSGLLGLGARVTWRAKHFGLWQQLTSQITAIERPVYFADAMIEGPFRWLKHEHFFRSLQPDRTEMRDIFCLAAPLGILGRLAELMVLRVYMRNLLRRRNAALRKIAESATAEKK